MNGILIIDKPGGLTSHDVVNRVRRILKQRAVGHLGTLDPMATGVLPLVLGNLTRLAQFYTHSEKSYEGTIHFGFSTDTYDAEGEPTSTPQTVDLCADDLAPLAAKFCGLIEQMPPPFSAKKIKGVPAYKFARKRQEVVLSPVQIEIKQLEILKVEGNHAAFRARVASGTYMRSVAHEIGKALGCGAHLESLRRTTVAEFSLDDAHTLEELAACAALVRTPTSPDRLLNDPHVTEALTACFVHPRRLLPQFPCVTADELTAARIRSGRTVNLLDLSPARQVKVFAGQRDLLCIATRVAGTLFHPKIVFASE